METETQDSKKKSDVKWFVVVIVLLALVAGWLLYKEGLIPGLSSGSKRPSILLITLDGVRFDRLGAAGYTPGVTPALDKLASGGALFSQCTTQAPISVAAEASLLTATNPYVHGVRYRGITPTPLGEGHVTLAEILSDRGYPTAARVTDPSFFQEYGLDQGIWPSNFVDPESQPPPMPRGNRGRGRAAPPPKKRFDAKETANSAITWLRKNGDKPFFFWVHIADCAAPHMPPEPYFSKYEKDPYMGDLAWVDGQVGRIVDELDHLGLRGKTLVVVASTFGEGLGDHIEDTHSWFLYDTTTRVPMIFSWPGKIRPGLDVKAQTRLIDAVPTILDLVGLGPKEDAEGKSLAPLLDGRADDLGLTAYSETLVPMIELQYFPTRSLRKGGWKYIHAPKPELYDLSSDPKEQKNLAGEQPDRVEAMRGELFTLVTGSATLPEIDPNSPGMTAGPEGELNDAFLLQSPGPDPKDHATEIQYYSAGQLLLSVGQFDRALTMFQKVVTTDPNLLKPVQMVIAILAREKKFKDLVPYMRNFLKAHPERNEIRFQLAEILEKEGDIDGAIEQMEWFEKAMKDNPQALKDLNVRIADLDYKAKRLDKAEERYKKALAGDPDNNKLRMNLILALTDAGKLDEAGREFVKPRKGEEGKPKKEITDHDIHYMLSKALAQKDHLDQAIAHMNLAAELEPGDGDTHLVLGAYLGKKGDLERCIAELLKARKLLPDSHDAAMNLAIAYKRTGRYAEAIDVLRKDIETNPDKADSLSLASLILAACPDDAIRSGDEALKYAKKACDLTKNQDPLALQSLAAALAEKGLFREAEKKAAEAINLFTARGRKVLAANSRRILMLFYKKDKPYREPRPAAKTEGAAKSGAETKGPGKEE